MNAEMPAVIQVLMNLLTVCILFILPWFSLASAEDWDVYAFCSFQKLRKQIEMFEKGQ